jgi:transcriptional regulator with XRE-family HTH domain
MSSHCRATVAPQSEGAARRVIRSVRWLSGASRRTLAITRVVGNRRRFICGETFGTRPQLLCGCLRVGLCPSDRNTLMLGVAPVLRTFWLVLRERRLITRKKSQRGGILTGRSKELGMPSTGGGQSDSARVLGALIRVGRRRKKLSQRQLASALPMSQAHLSRIELGSHTNPPSDDVLIRIARVLELDPRELLRAAGRQAAGPTFEAIALERLDQLIRAVVELQEVVARLERTTVSQRHT